MTDIITSAGTAVALIVTLAVFSLVLHKDNKFYRVIEAAVLGVSLGNFLVVALNNINSVGLTPIITKGDFLWIIPTILGILIFSRYVGSEYAWMSRYPLVLLIGVGTALSMRGAITSYIFVGISGFSLPIIGGSVTPIDYLIIVVFGVTILAYFLFTAQHKGPLGVVTKIGRYAMMWGFGYMFASVIATRFSWFIGRVLFILQSLGLA
jgi:hypothetical protein